MTDERAATPAPRLLDRTAWIALAAFGLLAIVATYPIAWHLTTHTAGDGADSNIFLWNAWWVGEALANGENPYFTNVMYWPAGTSLVLHTLSPLNALAALALTPLLGSIGAYNTLVIASFALCAWAAFLLARELTGSLGGATLAGLVYGFTPYHYAHALGHLNLITYHWLPLFLLFFLRHRATGKSRDAWLAALMLLGAALTDYALLLMSGMAAFALFLTAASLRDAAAWRRLFAPAWRAGAFLSPLALLIVLTWHGAPELRSFGHESSRYSLDVFGYIVPTPLSWLYGDVGTILTNDGTATEASVFLGFLGIALAAIGIWLTPRAHTKPWLITAAVFYVLSLGPVLQIAGKMTPILLPYATFGSIPLLDTLRTPARFAVIVILCVALLVAWGWRGLSERYAARLPRPRQAMTAIVPALAVILLAEAVVLPYPTTEFRISPLYDELSADDAEALIELPLFQPGYAGQFGRVNYLAAQTIHELPIVNGYNAREVGRDAQFMRAQLVLAAFSRLELGGVPPESPDIFPEQPMHPIAGDLLAARGLNRIMFHFADPPTEVEKREWAFLQTLGGLEVLHETPREVLLGTRPSGNVTERVTMDLGPGWHGLELRDGNPYRWAYDDPHVYLDAQGPTRAVFTANVSPYLTDSMPERNLDVHLNGEFLVSVKLEPGWNTIEIPLRLDGGANVLVLQSREEAITPARALIGPDTRALAMGVENVRLEIQ